MTSAQQQFLRLPPEIEEFLGSAEFAARCADSVFVERFLIARSRFESGAIAGAAAAELAGLDVETFAWLVLLNHAAQLGRVKVVDCDARLH